MAKEHQSIRVIVLRHLFKRDFYVSRTWLLIIARKAWQEETTETLLYTVTGIVIRKANYGICLDKGINMYSLLT